MTSQPVYQTVTIHKLPNISRSKDNQPTKFGQVMEIFFFKNHAENETGKLTADLFLFFKQAL